MRSFLKTNDRRRLEAIEYLLEKNTWVTLSDLAQKLKCSLRVLNEDISFLRTNYSDLTIETSNKGARLILNQNTGLKALYKRMLKESDTYKMLELIFFDETQSVNQLAEKLFISSSTLYRLIEQINGFLEENYDACIETNPCRVVGDEAKIRYFYYIYFSESYSIIEWPFRNLPENVMNELLTSIVSRLNVKIDFAYFNIGRLIISVNLTRYINGHRIHTKSIENAMVKLFFSIFNVFISYKKYEDKLNIKINTEFIYQVFTPYLKKGFVINYSMLQETAKKDSVVNEGFTYLHHLLNQLSQHNNLPLPNKTEVILGIHNSSHLEYQEPYSGYILYNRNKYFAQIIKQNFPEFYEQLYDGMKEYRRRVGKSTDDDGIYYLLYNLFTYWQNLLTELNKQLPKVHLLVMSDGHISHSKMIQNLLQYEFKDQLVIHIYEDMALNADIMKSLDYDIFISNFKLPEIAGKEFIYIEHFPNGRDIKKIANAMSRVIAKRTAEDDNTDYRESIASNGIGG